MGPEFPTPIVIGWDSSRSTYALQPLLREKPHLAGLPNPGAAPSDYFQTPYAVRDIYDGDPFDAYPVSEYAVVRTSFGDLLLVAAYLARARSHAETGTGFYELQSYAFGNLWPTPVLYGRLPLPSPRSARDFMRGSGSRPLAADIKAYARSHFRGR